MKKSYHSGIAVLALAVIGLPGCYHASVNTGRAPNGVVVQNQWAHSFIGGLGPPSTVETASQCPNGVATVSTQLSFLNMLAGAVTFGLYSPMTIRVECAGQAALLDEASVVRLSAAGSKAAAMEMALERSRETEMPVHVLFME